MNPFLEARLKQIQGMTFGAIQCNTAEEWARNDCMQTIIDWVRGSVSTKDFHLALNAIEDMFPSKKTENLTNAMRIAALYEVDEERLALLRHAWKPLAKHIRYKQTITY